MANKRHAYPAPATGARLAGLSALLLAAVACGTEAGRGGDQGPLAPEGQTPGGQVLPGTDSRTGADNGLTGRDGTAGPQAATPQGATPGPGRVLRPRAYAVCEGLNSQPTPDQLPRVQPLRLQNRPLLGVHCGAQVRILWEHGTPDGSILHEALNLTYTAAQTDGVSVPGPILGGDVNGDGATDLVVSFAVEGARGSPLGGALALLTGRGRGGALGRPQHLSGGHAIDLARDTTKGDLARDKKAADNPGLAVLHRGDERLSHGSELWKMTAEVAPRRSATRGLPAGARRFAPVDADGDKVVDWVVLDGRGGLHLLRSTVTEPDAGIAPKTRDPGTTGSADKTPIAAGVRAFAVADVNLDGHADLLWLTNDGVFSLPLPNPALNAAGPVAAVPCATGNCGSQLLAVDTDGDGRTDLVTHEPPDLVLYRNSPSGAFVREAATALLGENMEVVALVASEREGDAKPGVGIVFKPRAGAEYRLALVRGVFDLDARQDGRQHGTSIDLTASPQPPSPLPLRPQYTLP